MTGGGSGDLRATYTNETCVAQGPKVTFDDVAGIDEAEYELVENVDFLKDPPKRTRRGGTAPRACS